MKQVVFFTLILVSGCTPVGQNAQCHQADLKAAKVIGMTEAMMAVCPQVVNSVYAAQLEAAKAKKAKASEK